MAAIDHILSSWAAPAIQRIGWSLVHSLWQGLAVGAMLAIALAATRRRSANLRYVLACAAMLLMLAMPLTTYLLVRPPVAPESAFPVGPSAPPAKASVDKPAAPAMVANPPVDRQPKAGIEPPMRMPDEPPTVVVPPAVPEESAVAEHEVPNASPKAQAQTEKPAATVVAAAASPWQDRLARWFQPALPWMVLGWLIGVAGLSLWYLSGWLRVQRLRRRGLSPAPQSADCMLADLAARLGLRRLARVVESALVAVPTLVGWLRPIILLPACALTGLSAEQLESILAHELAHIRRHDYLVNLLQTLIETLLFYHPAIWWVSSRVRAERENCCDDLAVKLCCRPMVYARALTAIAKLSLHPEGEPARPRARKPALAADGGRLMSRIRRVIGQPDETSRWTRSWPIALLLLLALLVAVPLSCRPTDVTHQTGSSASAPHVNQPEARTPLLDDPMLADWTKRVESVYDAVLERWPRSAWDERAAPLTAAEKSAVLARWDRIAAALPKDDVLRQRTADIVSHLLAKANPSRAAEIAEDGIWPFVASSRYDKAGLKEQAAAAHGRGLDASKREEAFREQFKRFTSTDADMNDWLKSQPVAGRLKFLTTGPADDPWVRQGNRGFSHFVASLPDNARLRCCLALYYQPCVECGESSIDGELNIAEPILRLTAQAFPDRLGWTWRQVTYELRHPWGGIGLITGDYNTTGNGLRLVCDLLKATPQAKDEILAVAHERAAAHKEPWRRCRWLALAAYLEDGAPDPSPNWHAFIIKRLKGSPAQRQWALAWVPLELAEATPRPYPFIDDAALALAVAEAAAGCETSEDKLLAIDAVRMLPPPAGLPRVLAMAAEGDLNLWRLGVHAVQTQYQRTRQPPVKFGERPTPGAGFAELLPEMRRAFYGRLTTPMDLRFLLEMLAELNDASLDKQVASCLLAPDFDSDEFLSYAAFQVQNYPQLGWPNTATAFNYLAGRLTFRHHKRVLDLLEGHRAAFTAATRPDSPPPATRAEAERGTTFSSKLALDVWVYKEIWWEHPIGKTPSTQPISIPPGKWWGVTPDWRGNAPLDALREEAKTSGIRCLSLHDATDADLAKLHGWTELQSLDLGDHKVTDAGVEHVASLTGLRALRFIDCHMTNAGLRQLQRLPHLQMLSLSATVNITGDALAELKTHKELHTLSIVCNGGISNASLSHLKELPELKSLTFSSTALTGKGLIHLKGLPKLEQLNLCDCRITDAAAEQFKDGFSRLRQLQLVGTSVTDAGLAYIEGLSELRDLDLRGTPITDAAVPHLKHLTNLERLTLIATKMTDAGVEALRVALPKTVINWSSSKPATQPADRPAPAATQPDATDGSFSFTDSDDPARRAMVKLLTAAVKGDEAVVKEMITQEPRLLNEQCPASNSSYSVLGMWARAGEAYYDTEHGGTVLHAAANGGHRDLVKFLLDKGAKVNGTDSQGFTPLHAAAMLNPTTSDVYWSAMAKAAQTRPAEEPDQRLGEREARDAAKKKRAELIRRSVPVAELLLASGADINAAARDPYASDALFAKRQPRKGETPLAVAARTGNMAMATFLLDKGATLDFASAIRMGLADRVARMLDKDAALATQPDVNKSIPLSIAVEAKWPDLVKLLLSRGADANGVEGCFTPLATAMNAENTELIKLLLDAGANPNGPQLWGGALIARAAQKGDLALVRLLVEHGARLDESSFNSSTSLFEAACGDHQEVVDYLLAKGAAINGPAGKDWAWTPLIGALYRGRVTMAQHLVDRGARVDVSAAAALGLIKRLGEILQADPSAVGRSDRSPSVSYENGVGLPLNWAAKFGQIEAAKLLIDRGADVNARSGFHGLSPLHEAAAGGHAEMVRFLLDNGAFVDARARHEARSVLSWALPRPDNEKVIGMLLDAGANPNAMAYVSYMNTGWVNMVDEARKNNWAAEKQLQLVSARAKGRPVTYDDAATTLFAAEQDGKFVKVRWLLRVATLENGNQWFLRKDGREIELEIAPKPIWRVDDIQASPDGRFLAVRRLGGSSAGTEYYIDIVDLPALLTGHYRVMAHRWSAYQIRPVGWSAGRMILSSPALLNRGDARGEVDRNLFMENEERFAADPRTGKVEPLGPNARDPIAYYTAHRRLPGQTKPGLVALGDRSAIGRLEELLSRTTDSAARAEITGVIAELEKLPQNEAVPAPPTTQPAANPAPAAREGRPATQGEALPLDDAVRRAWAADGRLWNAYQWFFVPGAEVKPATLADLDALLDVAVADIRKRIYKGICALEADHPVLKGFADKGAELSFVTNEDFEHPSKPAGPVSRGPGYLRIWLDLASAPPPNAPSIYNGGRRMDVWDLHRTVRVEYYSRARDVMEKVVPVVDREVAPLIALAGQAVRPRVAAAYRQRIEQDIKDIKSGHGPDRWMVAALTMLKDRQTAPILLDYLAGKHRPEGKDLVNFWAGDSELLTTVIDYLAAADARESAPVLLDVLKQSRHLREPAIRAVTRLGVEQAAPILISLLDDPDQDTRFTALRGLVHFEGKQAVDEVLARAKGNEDMILLGAIQARPLSERYFPLIQTILAGETAPESNRTMYSFWALDNIGSPAARGLLLKYARAGNSHAVTHLGGFADRQTCDYLLGVLLAPPGPNGDTNPRSAAEQALARMPQLAVPELIRILRTEGVPAFVRARLTLIRIYGARQPGPRFALREPWEGRARPTTYPDNVTDMNLSGPERQAAAAAWERWWKQIEQEPTSAPADKPAPAGSDAKPAPAAPAGSKGSPATRRDELTELVGQSELSKAKGACQAQFD